MKFLFLVQRGEGVLSGVDRCVLDVGELQDIVNRLLELTLSSQDLIIFMASHALTFPCDNLGRHVFWNASNSRFNS